MAMIGFFVRNARAQCGSINFKANTTKGCPLLLVKFNATGASSASGASFKWDFGSGFVSGNDTITKAFSNPGQYTVKMQATLSGASAACQVITKDTFITVHPLPVPIITADPGFLDCSTAPVKFTDSTVGSVSRQWVINGKKDTTGLVVSYFQPGSYDIDLFSTNKFGCTGFATKTENVHLPLEMDMCDSFTATPTYIKGEFVPQIINRENLKITGYLWSFPGGNPSSSTKESPSNIIYSDASKKYDITLAVGLNDGCTYTFTRNSVVTSFISLAFRTLCAGTSYPITLESNASSYDYLFPNARISLDQDTVTYYATGNYSANVNFEAIPYTCPVVVHYPFFVKVLGPATKFSSDNAQICHSTDTVNLINNTDTLNAPNTNFTWYIFDSTDTKLLSTNNQIGPMTDFDTTYIPGRTGKFGVSLVAISTNGCKDSTNIPYFITAAKPKSDFYSIRDAQCHGNTIYLTSEPTPSEGPNINYIYAWSVINENLLAQPDSSTDPIFGFKTDSLGTYDVTLVISNGHCKSDTTKKAFFNIIGDLTKIVVDDSVGCLNPTFSTIAHLGREEKFPDDPNHPPLYRWWVKGYDSQFVHFSDSNSISTRVLITKSGCHEIYMDITTILNDDTCIFTYPTITSKPALICVGPTLDFDIGTPSCPGDTVGAHNFSAGGTYGFKWSVLPAGQADIIPSDTSRDVKIIFKTDTCYKVILSGSKNVNGTICTDRDTVPICLAKLPKPDFYTTTPTLYCAPSVGTFVNTTKGNTTSIQYIWDFGDGGNLINPPGTFSPHDSASHVYRRFNKAEYDISLTAIDILGCKASISKKAVINIIGPVPLFTMDETKGCDSVTVHFTNTSSNVKKFYFVYDDGSPIDSIDLAPHKYVLDPSLDSITYYPALLSLDDTACRDYFQDTIKIYRSSSDVKIVTDVSKGCIPLTVHFNAVSKLANTWKWDFDGDGIIDDSTDQNPVFTYTKPGTYKATLVVSNHGQCPVTTFSNTITVAPKAVANFTPLHKTFCAGQDITFKNTSTNSVSFLFNYGDSSAVDNNVLSAHHYFYDTAHNTADSVSFYPKLIAYNAAGCTDTIKATITAYRMPVPGFKYSFPSGCNPHDVKFTDTSRYNFTAQWDYDNNGTIDGFGKNVDHVFGPGLYTVKLRAISIEGCVDSAIDVNLISVNRVPRTDFSVSDSDVCYKQTVSFTNLTQPADSVTKWSWKFNDPDAPYDTSSSKNPVFTFYAKGWHIITLTASDNKGCTDNISKRAVFVEDTLPPPNTKLLYVSVIDNHTVQAVYNKSNLYHFDSYVINRLSNGAAIFSDSVKPVNDTIFSYIDNAINTSDSSYCFDIQTQNQCSRISLQSPDHCTILLSGIADPGPSNLLNWTAYSGWIPELYYIYRADSGGAFKKIDSVKGGVLTWSDTALCDDTYCYYVAAKKDSASYISNSNNICLRTKYAHQISSLNLRYATVIDNNTIELRWDTLAYKGLAGYQLGKYYPKIGWIDNYAFTTADAYTDATAKINDSSYTYRVRTIDKCGYPGPESNIGTSILLKQYINKDNVALSWNGYHNWQSGVQNYLVQIQLKNRQFKTVANLPETDTTYTDDSVYNAIDTAYCYRVIAIENGTRQDSSMSNLTCAVLPSRVFIPNAFSPNGDSTNDVWKVSAISIYNQVGSKLLQFDAKVYNRWGTLVFESNDIYKGWDGKFKGESVPADVYIYLISAEGIDKRHMEFTGNITLIR